MASVLFGSLKARYDRAINRIDLICQHHEKQLLAKYLAFRKNLAKRWIAKKLKKEYDFNLVVWVDYLLRFNEEDAKRHAVLAALFVPIFTCFILKIWFSRKTYLQEMYIYYYCWIIFLLYELIYTMWFWNIDNVWLKQSSKDYQDLFNAYQNLSFCYDSLKKEHTYAKKQIRYIEASLKSQGVQVTTSLGQDGVLEDMAQPDLNLTKMTAANPQNEGSQTNESTESTTCKGEEVAFSVNSETANSSSNPSESVTNPTIVVDQVANSGGTDPNADTEAVTFVAESETVHFSAGSNTDELAGDGQKAKQDFSKECEWEIVDEMF